MNTEPITQDGVTVNRFDATIRIEALGNGAELDRIEQLVRELVADVRQQHDTAASNTMIATIDVNASRSSTRSWSYDNRPF